MPKKLQLDHATAVKGSVLTAILSCLFGGVAIALLPEIGIMSATDSDVWRPPALVWSGLCLLAAGILAYYGARTSLQPATDPKKSARISILQKGLIGVAVLGLVVAITFPKISIAVARALERQWPATLSTNAIQVTLHMEMDCQACARGIVELLRGQSGLEKAEVKFEQQELRFWYNPRQTSKRSVIADLKSRGYSPRELGVPDPK